MWIFLGLPVCLDKVMFVFVWTEREGGENIEGRDFFFFLSSSNSTLPSLQWY